MKAGGNKMLLKLYPVFRAKKTFYVCECTVCKKQSTHRYDNLIKNIAKCECEKHKDWSLDNYEF